MAKKMKLLKPAKQFKKDFQQVAINSVVRGVGDLAAGVVVNKLGAMVPVSYQPFLKPALFIGSVLGEAYLAEPMAQAAFQGMQAASFSGTVKQYMPVDMQTKFGLGETEPDQKFWDELADQAVEQTAQMSGNDMPEYAGEEPEVSEDVNLENLGDYYEEDEF